MTSDERIREAFAEVARGLMEWNDPPLPDLHEEIRRYLAFTDELGRPAERRTWTPIDKQGEVEPYDVDQDWTDTGN